jgi:hypothetical protein
LKRLGLPKAIEEQQNLCRDIGDEEGLAWSLANFAWISKVGFLGKKGQEQLDEAEEIATRNGFQDILDFIRRGREAFARK